MNLFINILNSATTFDKTEPNIWNRWAGGVGAVHMTSRQVMLQMLPLTNPVTVASAKVNLAKSFLDMVINIHCEADKHWK